MTAPKNDGGPAFPAVTKSDYPNEKFGMTLRDYFAAKAMQGMLASCAHPEAGWLDDEKDAIAYFAVRHADALIASLAK